MTNEMVIAIINFVVLVAYICYQKYILPNIDVKTLESATETVDTAYELYQKFGIITDMAKKFVILAKASLKDASGSEKRDWVIDQLKGICEKVDLILTDEELKAINESAYDEMCKDDSLYTKDEENK